MCPVKPKIFTGWPFTEKVCQPLFSTNSGVLFLALYT